MQTTLEQPELVAEAHTIQTAEDKGGCLQGMVGRPVEPIDLYAEHAKEKAHLPANWRIYKWECFPKGGDETIYVAVTGAVCEHFKAGERKNERNWKLRDKNTERTVNLPCGEHEAWKLEWEKRTGKCSRCTGDGEVLESWSVANGVKNRPCPKCKVARTPNYDYTQTDSYNEKHSGTKH